MKKNVNIEILIAHSFSGMLTPDEREYLETWLNESEENQKQYMQLLNLWQVSQPAFDPEAIDVVKAERQFMSKIAQPAFRSQPFWGWWQRVAAIIILPLLLYAGYLTINSGQRPSRMVYQDIFSPYGTVSKIMLPDSSFVWLNSGSHLRTPIAFDDNERRVILSGEGYFEVESDKKHPFIVETAKANIRATGTHFNVEAYSSDSITAVTLVEGKLDVDIENKLHANIKPNERLVFNANIRQYDLTHTDSELWTLWKDGKLVFRDEPLDEVFKRISRAFNVEISIKGKAVAKLPYRATFEGESLDEILRLLRLTAPLRYERSGKRKVQNDTYAKEKIDVYKLE
ncbi:MAG: DUF4974 domain-containing protein [Paludibacter sp.]